VTAPLIERYAGFAIDLDGVVWRGRSLVDGTHQAVAAIRQAGKDLLFLTNNASWSPSAVAQFLMSNGVEAEPEQVLNPAIVGVEWLRAKDISGRRAFVLGDPVVEEQFAAAVDVIPVQTRVQVDVVIVARDTRFDFSRLAAAADAARSGAALIAVNRDVVMPVEGGFEPGTGSILAAVELASGKTATVLGKPELPMMEAAARLLPNGPVLMIGDQPSSDVAGARLVGWDAAIVLTGVTRPGDPLEPPPDYVLESLGGILDPQLKDS
jgi:4-nitrophenyl phosphatase